MNEKEKYIESVVKLILLTNDGKLQWHRTNQNGKVHAIAPNPLESYESEFAGRKLYFCYNPFRTKAVLNQQVTELINCSLIVSKDGTIELEYPDIAALSGLHAAIRQQLKATGEPFLSAVANAV